MALVDVDEDVDVVRRALDRLDALLDPREGNPPTDELSSG
jgi:hypothetical protein